MLTFCQMPIKQYRISAIVLFNSVHNYNEESNVCIRLYISALLMNIYQNVHIISVLLMFQAAFFLVLDDEPQFYDRVSPSFYTVVVVVGLSRP